MELKKKKSRDGRKLPSIKWLIGGKHRIKIYKMYSVSICWATQAPLELLCGIMNV